MNIIWPASLSPTLVLLFLFFGAILFWINHRLKRGQFLGTLKLKLLLIRQPFPNEADANQQTNPLQPLNLTGELCSILSGLKKPFALEAAVSSVGEDINFYLAVPRESVEFASRAIQGLWNDAEITAIDDYNIFHPQGFAVAAYARLKKHCALPIRTFQEAGFDTFAPILNNFSKLSHSGEGMAFQLIVRPAPQSAVKNIKSILGQLKKGASLDESLDWKFLKLFSSSKADGNQKTETKIIDEAAVRSVEQKLAKSLLSVNARIVVSADSRAKAEELLSGLINSFSQFSSPQRNEFKFFKINRPAKLTNFIFRHFQPAEEMILSTDEIVSIFHFPSATTKVPKINWLKYKEAPAPLNLPTEGLYLGDNIFRGETKKVFLDEEDRLKHVYIIGQTGTGKSNLLNILARSDIKNGKGLAVIDPHGSLIESLLGAIPVERHNDVVIFDPADIERPVGLNMLEYNFGRPEQKTFVVNELFSILDKLYDMKMVGGPIFEQYMKNATLLLMEDMPNEQATLMEIPRVFTDDGFRERKLKRISNPTVIDFWTKEALAVKGEHSLANIAPYITSKFNNFIANDYLRPIIGQVKSAFSFRQIMDEGKILLINLSKGRIGDINANLLGMIFVGKILMAALSRTDVPESERPVFNFYIDEFQNFTTDSIAIILSEARKYRLSLTIAHQFIGQLTDKTRDAVFGNVGSMISFRVGLNDVEFLAKQFEPTFSKRDLVNLDNLNAYAKILIADQTAPPFNLRMQYEGEADTAAGKKLKELSRLKYGRPRQEVESEILKRLRE